jgi:hypothetical protein
MGFPQPNTGDMQGRSTLPQFASSLGPDQLVTKGGLRFTDLGSVLALLDPTVVHVTTAGNDSYGLGPHRVDDRRVWSMMA